MSQHIKSIKIEKYLMSSIIYLSKIQSYNYYIVWYLMPILFLLVLWVSGIVYVSYDNPFDNIHDIQLSNSVSLCIPPYGMVQPSGRRMVYIDM